MPKTDHTSGSIVEADFLNALNRPVFDGQDLDGHYPKITNADLSDDPSQIKGEWTTFRDQLKVSAASGLTVTYKGGAFTNLNGLTQTVANGTLGVANNTTAYIFVNPSGTVQAANALPLTSIPLAAVTTVNGTIANIADLRPRFAVQSQFRAVRTFGGSGNEGTYALTGTDADTLLQGEYYFSSFTVEAGATLTIDKLARIYVSGFVNIAGTLIVTPALAGGGSLSGANLGDAPLGRLTGNGPGGGSGGSSGASYNYLVSPTGSGGASGSLYGGTINDKGTIGTGGKGGGGLMIEAAGSITISGTITCEGGNAGNNASTLGLPKLGGAGGGSGGLVLLKSLISVTLTSSATVSVKGGLGSNAIGGPTGGGGGSGGQVVLISPNNNATGATLNLSGGAAGTPTTGTQGGGAGGSFGGVGGAGSAQVGNNGQLILRNFLPVA